MSFGIKHDKKDNFVTFGRKTCFKNSQLFKICIHLEIQFSGSSSQQMNKKKIKKGPSFKSKCVRRT